MFRSSSDRRQGRRSNELFDALRSCRSGFLGIALLSCALNLLFLTGSFYMLEVYDRVLPSGSVPALIGLAIIAGTLYAFQAAIDIIRGRLLARVGTAVEGAISGRTLQAVTQLPMLSGTADSVQPSRDLDTVRSFLSGPGPTALFDLPWMPLYLFICFAFHPAIGWTATLGSVILIALALYTEIASRRPVERTYTLSRERNSMSEAFMRNSEVVRSMGMERNLGERWTSVNDDLAGAQQTCSDVNASLGAISKVARMVLQSAVLTVGAYVVIQQEATGGIIIASSILSSRALAPVELAIGHWRSFINARASWRRLDGVLERLPIAPVPLDLPAPARELGVEGLCVVPPGSRAVSVRNASFLVRAGDGLGVIGPSASGKSSLIRAIVGAWAPADGAVRLDGASLAQWDRNRLGAHIGYLPQELQLFPGTIAQNIARFDPQATPEQVVEAAQVAGVHDMIVRLPDGYSTVTGESGTALSAGQRQRIGLARALFGNPFLVVLDEPNSSLDAEGESALTRAIASVRLRGGIAIVVAHRPSALTALNLVLMMGEGQIQAFGPKDEVLGRILLPNAPPAPSKPVLAGQITQTEQAEEAA